MLSRPTVRRSISTGAAGHRVGGSTVGRVRRLSIRMRRRRLVDLRQRLVDHRQFSTGRRRLRAVVVVGRCMEGRRRSRMGEGMVAIEGMVETEDTVVVEIGEAIVVGDEVVTVGIRLVVCRADRRGCRRNRVCPPGRRWGCRRGETVVRRRRRGMAAVRPC